MGSSPEPDMLPPALEEGNTSNVSMVHDSLVQHDLDIMVKEEREEAMETGAPPVLLPPHLPKSHGCRKALRPGTLMTNAARCPRKAQIKTHPMTQILMRMSYWGQSLTSLFPGDIQMTPLPSSFPQRRMTCNHLKREEFA